MVLVGYNNKFSQTGWASGRRSCSQDKSSTQQSFTSPPTLARLPFPRHPSPPRTQTLAGGDGSTSDGLSRRHSPLLRYAHHTGGRSSLPSLLLPSPMAMDLKSLLLPRPHLQVDRLLSPRRWRAAPRKSAGGGIQRTSLPKTPSSRSCRGCRTSRCAGSSASPSGGAASSPTPTTARRCRSSISLTSPDSSTPRFKYMVFLVFGDDQELVFGNGFLHLVTRWSAVVAVDVEGTTWRVIPMPCNPVGPDIDLALGFTDLSQGRLYFANIDHRDGHKLLIWVLEDYGSEVWVLKHSVRPFDLFGVKYVHPGIRFHIVAVHPQRNMVFLVFGDDQELMSYEMDSGKVQLLTGGPYLGNYSLGPYLPYVPLYSEELADWN